MDRPQNTYSALDELRQIQAEVCRTDSLDHLRFYFDRVHVLRRTYADDFDMQLAVAETQEQIIERARALREGLASQSPEPARTLVRHPQAADETQENPEAAEIPADVPRVDTKTWQRAIYLALFFTVLICAGFFYLIQTARRINLPPAEVSQPQTAPAGKSAPVPVKSASNTPVPTRPTVRLYTDLVPGTVSVDGGPPQDLKDGELMLENVQTGRHSVKVTGRTGNAGFTFEVDPKLALHIIGLPTTSNALAVLVSTEDGKGRVLTNAENATLQLDGKPVGDIGAEGLALDNLGNTDHDLQLVRSRSKERFILTHTPAPALTVYVKSDPNTGTLVIVTGQDGVDVFVNDSLYRRKTERGQLRIPLKVGLYNIRVHKAGFIDPPAEKVEVKKAEDTAVEFRMELLPEVANLDIKNALPGTMVYVDKELVATTGSDGMAKISNVKPGEHSIELRRDQAISKKFDRTFRAGEVVELSGPDVALQSVATESKPATRDSEPRSETSAGPEAGSKPENHAVVIEGAQVRKGGGFVAYHVPKVPGHYSFEAQGRIGGFLKRNKLQWYAGFQDEQNYVLFTVDGKHAIVRDVKDGKSREVNRIDFDVDSNQWVQVDLSVTPDLIDVRLKTQDGAWSDLGRVSSSGRDFTKDKVGFYIPGNDEVAVSNFRFSNR